MHQICYDDYDVTVDKQKIVDDVLRTVRCNGDGYGTESVRFLSGTCHTREEDENKINENDSWYGGYAVRYYDYSGAKNTKTMQEILQQIEDTKRKQHLYQCEHRSDMVKAEYIGCKNCGSKLSRKYLSGRVKCPMCGKDLRSETVLTRLQSFETKITRLRQKYEAEKQKQVKYRKEKWLVKFEFHC